MGTASSPHDVVLKVILAEDHIQHHLHVMRGVPVAVVVEAAGFLEDAGQFDAAGASWREDAQRVALRLLSLRAAHVFTFYVLGDASKCVGASPREDARRVALRLLSLSAARRRNA